MRPSFRLFFVLAAIAPAVGSCSSSTDTSGPKSTASIWVAPASLDDLAQEKFYDHPWPSDVRRDADGSVHLAGFYNPRLVPLVDGITSSLKGALHGFSPAASAYFRFTGDIDPASLPASPQAALDPGSSIQIVDVDPASPEHGKRRLAQTFWWKDEGIYIRQDTLAVAPALGYPLRAKTRYAIVVTNGVRAADGRPISRAPDLDEVLGIVPATPHTQAAHDLFAPVLAELASAGVPATNIVHFTSFTTNDPTAQLFAVADDARANAAMPTADPQKWTAMETTADYDVYEGMYGPSPNYQAGKLPFAHLGDGGAFAFDASGKPILQSTFSLRFTFVVPNAQKCPIPANGYPMVLYAHGTGGDYRSIVDEGNSLGQAFAQQCLASMGVDQIFHGIRPGAPPLDDPNRESEIEVLFFNFDNPVAGRTNGQQSAIDVLQQARLFTETHVTVPASISRTAAAIGFDATRVMFAGHSQGGLNGPLFLAADDQARGGLLSGSGSMITVALLEKTKPTPSIAALVKTVLGLNGELGAELNLFHPALNLAQALVDPTDPIHYQQYITQHPRTVNGRTFAVKSTLQTEGVRADGTGDSYAPPHGIELGAVAAGLPRMAPGVHPVSEAAFGGLGDVSVPAGGLSGNLGGGSATGVLAQFVPTSSDGHFVVFDVPACRALAAGFMKNLADDPKGKIPGGM